MPGCKENGQPNILLKKKKLSRGFVTKRKKLGISTGCCCSVDQLCLTLCNTTDCSLPASSVHEVFLQEYWSGLPFPSSRDFPHSGIEPESLALAGRFFTTEPPGKPIFMYNDTILQYNQLIAVFIKHF